VLAEAAAAGLPIIATSACGASAELVVDYYNGRIIPPRDADSLASAMNWAEASYHDLPQLGARSMELARPYAAEVVAERWMRVLEELTR
jgi:glycosyltransferase involved in cell wall biosynthesis